MKELKSTIKKNLFFLVPWLLFVLFGAALLFIFSKSEITLIANGNNSEFLDIFFKVVTRIGEAPIIIFVLIISMFKSIRTLIASVAAFVVNGIYIAITKFLIFGPLPRPRKFINNDSLMHFIDGVEMHLRFTFPSGHTTTAFVGFLLLSHISKSKWIKLICFIAAASVAYSRMYLAQHFFKDIYWGSISGVVIAILCISLINKINKPKLDRPIFSKK